MGHTGATARSPCSSTAAYAASNKASTGTGSPPAGVIVTASPIVRRKAPFTRSAYFQEEAGTGGPLALLRVHVVEEQGEAGRRDGLHGDVDLDLAIGGQGLAQVRGRPGPDGPP